MAVRAALVYLSKEQCLFMVSDGVRVGCIFKGQDSMDVVTARKQLSGILLTGIRLWRGGLYAALKVNNTLEIIVSENLILCPYAEYFLLVTLLSVSGILLISNTG